MQQRMISALIGVGAAGLLFLSMSAMAEERGKARIESVKPVQQERDLETDLSSPSIQMDKGGGGVQPNGPLHFEAAPRRRTTPPEREEDALRFHQNTVLERFENTDSHGQIFLSFSGDRFDLTLRSMNGAEAPIAEARSSGK